MRVGVAPNQGLHPVAAKKIAGKVLRPVHPNVGLEAEFRQVLVGLVQAMHDSVTYWLSAAYKRNEPAVAQLAADEQPAAALKKAVRNLRRRWTKNWNDAAPKLAKWFATAVNKRSDKVLAKILKDAGIAVDFKMSAAMRDVVGGSVNQGVALIKSIPQQYLAQVEVLVMQSVTAGRDLAPLAKQLQKQFGVTKRRAALIARDQNNKATAAMTRARQLELGITQAVWMHSGGGREPRPTHVANSGKPYDVTKGWLDPAEGRYIFPGELINCRCVAKAVVQGFS